MTRSKACGDERETVCDQVQAGVGHERLQMLRVLGLGRAVWGYVRMFAHELTYRHRAR
jgi:hypothetical protein